MTLRLTAAALLALAPLAGCTWENRPDGGNPMHTDGDDKTYMTDRSDDTDLVEPIVGGAAEAPAGVVPQGLATTPVDPALPTTPGDPTPTAPVNPDASISR